MVDKLVRKLVLVEKAAQVKTLETIFKQIIKKTEKWIVLPTNGHISVIDTKNVIDELFELNWIPIPNKIILKKIKEQLITADYVYIITNDNREGEELAYHLQDLALTYSNARIYRLYVNTLTVEEIKQALKTQLNISKSTVDAHRASLVINHLINDATSYSIKNIFNKSFSIDYLSLFILNEIIDKEYEFRTQNAEDFFQVEAKTNNKSTVLSKKLKSYQEAEDILSKINNKSLLIDYCIKKEEINAPPPFNTFTALSYINRYCNFKIQYIIHILKNLYEQGLISFFYTESQALSKPYAYDTWSYLKTNKYIAIEEDPQYYEKFGNAIVPTDIANLPSHIELEIDTDSAKVYEIIWYRTIFTQYPPIFSHKQQAYYYLEEDEKTLLTAQGRKIKLKGWLYLDIPLFFEKEQTLDENSLEISHAMIRTYKDKKYKKQYTQASLLDWVASKKICRPEDFTKILIYLEKHNYIKTQSDYIVTPTVRGEQVINSLKHIASDILDKKFILQIRKDVDGIENQIYQYKDIIKKYNRWCLRLKKKERKKSNNLCTICKSNLYTLDNGHTWCQNCD